MATAMALSKSFALSLTQVLHIFDQLYETAAANWLVRRHFRVVLPGALMPQDLALSSTERKRGGRSSCPDSAQATPPLWSCPLPGPPAASPCPSLHEASPDVSVSLLPLQGWHVSHYQNTSSESPEGRPGVPSGLVRNYLPGVSPSGPRITICSQTCWKEEQSGWGRRAWAWPLHNHVG